MPDPRLAIRSLMIFSLAIVLLLGQAAIPLEQFIQRGDDAFYYFKIALNYPELGFWTFDRLHPTNGVQPLWAVLLSGIAQVLHWSGVNDPILVARIFVAVTGAFHFASCMLLFLLLSRTMSIGVAIAATGASLFSIGLVWSRVWGMENSLYAFMLLATACYFHLVHLVRATSRTAILLGILLGATALARLNAGLLIPCLLLYWLWAGTAHPVAERFRLAVVTGLASTAVLLPYLFWNYQTTGHLLPISGAVKAVAAQQFLEAQQIDTRFSLDFLKTMYWRSRDSVLWFLTSRAGDGLWILGGRVIFRPGSAIEVPTLLAVLGGLLAAPIALGQPKEWISYLKERLSRLAPFSYLMVFACLNAVVSIFLYPNQLDYAIVRWWLVESEIALIVIVSAIVMAPISYLSERLVSERRRVNVITAVLLALVGFHLLESARYFLGKEYVVVDWNQSWNDESYAAAIWLEENVPVEARVGSWNAGVLGYYARQRVTNLDGLINNYDLLPYLEQKRVHDYIRTERIDYLSDMESIFTTHGVLRNLSLTEVYSSYSPLMHQHYRIYKVDH